MSVMIILLIIANCIVSYIGFTNNQFFERYKFEVDKILTCKDYKRILTSGFLHISWLHLVFNIVTLYFFSVVETYLGTLAFLLVYFSGLAGGNLLSLLIHKNQSAYSSVGASGAICGIIFAAIAIFPGFKIGFWGLPLMIPGWVYGLIYVLYSLYGIRSNKNNISHEAHLGGALIGMLVALIIKPSVFSENYFTLLVISIPVIAFIFLIVRSPGFLLTGNYFFKKQEKYYTQDQKYNIEKNTEKKEVDQILEKIHKSGIGSLTKKEEDTLKKYAGK